MPHAATVDFVPLRNDLANLPSSLAGLLFSANIPAQEAVIEIQFPHGSVFCGWTGLSASNPENIELDPAFATNLGLQHQQHVNLLVKPRIPVAHSVLLEPVSVGDWEIAETHVSFLEAFMINQVRTVSVGKIVTLFPSSTSLAALKVVRIEPDLENAPVARLSPECEVIIAPRTRQSDLRAEDEKKVGRDDNNAKRHAINTIRRSTVHPFLPGLSSLCLEIHGNITGLRDRQLVLVGSVIPNTLQTTTNVGNSEDITRCTQVIARYFQADFEFVGLSYGLQSALGIKNGVGVQVSVSSDIPASFPPISATIRPYATNIAAGAASRILVGQSEVINADDLSLKIVTRGQVVAPHAVLLPMGGIIDTESPGFGTVKQVKLGAEMPLAESKRMEHIDTIEKNNKHTRPLVGQDMLMEKLETTLLDGNGVLLYGSRGCGKSSVLKNIASRLAAQHVRSVWFKCSNYSDKAVSTVREALRKTIYEALWSSPAVLLLDDLDKLSPAQQEHTGDSNRVQQIAEIVCSLLLPLIEMGKISVLATAQDQTAVHKFLLSSHTLDFTLHLKSPDKDTREAILRTAIDRIEGLEPADDLDLLEVVAETEGYQPGDLWVLMERVASLMALDDTENEPTFVTAPKILAAAKDFVPASLRGIKLETSSVNWDEVGGMVEAKRIVLETLEWPTKYAPIFANCPLRLRSGLLLYGYPGCGKTMLASAIASKTGLNFISVKGPEILNKYIGASEKSVRDLFERAQAAKPCVLFFDEFDSVAPKRGHDATGVTDRVVNQLLTQMDGAEGLDGVYVLAATSRPDLIDSALLRPGRLDKSILCDMPNASSRLDILQKATRKLNVQNELDLKFFADKTSGFSGADVQALIYNAYLKGVHTVLSATEAVNNPQAVDAQLNNMKWLHAGAGTIESSRAYLQTPQNISGNREVSNNPGNMTSAAAVVLSIDDLSQALKESKPSISPQEAARFRAIYSEFCSDRNGEMPLGTSSNEIGGRVTLQ